MAGRLRFPAGLCSAVLLPALCALIGCHSYHVETTVENRTGAAIQLLEVDYPNASFGADSLASVADFHYRIQIESEGPIKVQYTTPDGQQEQITGPSVSRHQQGRLEVVLLPGGKAEFHPELTAGR